ncbi:hypothetical protein BQ1740_2067 [Bacillus subtilis]|nr:hypothetical protein BQ1740_2067 [Bacillus subtilis]
MHLILFYPLEMMNLRDDQMPFLLIKKSRFGYRYLHHKKLVYINNM